MWKTNAIRQQFLCHRQQRSHQCPWHVDTRCAGHASTPYRCGSAPSTAPSLASPVSMLYQSTPHSFSSSGVGKCQPGLLKDCVRVFVTYFIHRYRALPAELQPEEVEPYRLALRLAQLSSKNLSSHTCNLSLPDVWRSWLCS